MQGLKLLIAGGLALACLIAFLGMLEGYTNGTSSSFPNPLLLVGFVASVAFGIWSFVAPRREARALAEAASDPLRFVELLVRKTRAKKLIAGAVMAVMGTMLAVLPIFLDDGSIGERAFIACLGLMGWGLALVFVWPARMLMDPPNAPILRTLREAPERVVWVYEFVMRVNGFPARTVLVCRDDGEKFELHLGELDAAPVLDALATKVPHAIFGYHPDLANEYRRDPASVRPPAPGPAQPSAAS